MAFASFILFLKDTLPAVVRALKAGKVDLNDAAVTVTLLKANSVIGLTGFLDHAGNLNSVEIQCSLCHSTVRTVLNSCGPEVSSTRNSGDSLSRRFAPFMALRL